MTTINKSALVTHSANDMYKLVDDIEAYPEFLPWCKSTTVLSRTKDEVRASIQIAHSEQHCNDPGQVSHLRFLPQ